MNNQSLIYLIAHHLRQKDRHVIYAEGDPDVDNAKAAVAMSAYKSTILIGGHPTEWSWTVQDEKMIPVMMVDINPAPRPGID